MGEQSASTHFIKWPLGKDKNCPKSILAATAGGLISRQHLLKTLTSAWRLFPTTARTGQAFPPELQHHLPEPHKVTRMCWIHPHFPLCTQGVDTCGGRFPVSLLVPEPCGQHILGLAQGTATPQPGPLAVWRWQGMRQMFHQPAHLHWSNWGRNIICSVGEEIVTENSWGQIGMEEHKIPPLAQPNPEGNACPHPQLLKVSRQNWLIWVLLVKKKGCSLLLVLSALVDPNGLCFGDWIYYQKTKAKSWDLHVLRTSTWW